MNLMADFRILHNVVVEFLFVMKSITNALHINLLHQRSLAKLFCNNNFRTLFHLKN